MKPKAHRIVHDMRIHVPGAPVQRFLQHQRERYAAQQGKPTTNKKRQLLCSCKQECMSVWTIAVGPAHYIRHLEAAAIKKLNPEGNTKLENTFDDEPLRFQTRWPQQDDDKQCRSRPWPRFRAIHPMQKKTMPTLTQVALRNMEKELSRAQRQQSYAQQELRASLPYDKSYRFT